MLKVLKDFGINSDNKVFIIAEIGINHNGNLELAKKLIDSAKRAGADAVKFQTYVTEKRVSTDSPIFNILKRCELSFEDFKQLKSYSEHVGIEFFSTPFDEESLNLLESLGCSLYKVASFDITNLNFLNKLSETGKTLIMSVGMSSLDEIKNAYSILSRHSNKIALLHCVSAYPTKESDANLAAIFSLKDNFNCLIGQSDHTNDIFVPFCAAAGGAQIIEKHYKISSDMECPDGAVSITEDQMIELVGKIRRLEKIWGHGRIELTDPQKDILVYRRNSSI